MCVVGENWHFAARQARESRRDVAGMLGYHGTYRIYGLGRLQLSLGPEDGDF
jgi:hypothetical protein